jgi:hypothetical protein
MEELLAKISLKAILWRTFAFILLLGATTWFFQQEKNFQTFQNWYIGQANYWLEDIRSPGRAVFRVHKDFNDVVEAELTNRHQIESAMEEARRTRSTTIDARATSVTFRLWTFALLPILLCLSLITILPGSWKQKPLQLLVGFLIMLIYTFIKLYIFISIQFHNVPNLEIVRYTGFWSDIMSTLHLILLSTTFNLGVAVFAGFISLGSVPVFKAIYVGTGNFFRKIKSALKRKKKPKKATDTKVQKPRRKGKR